MRVASWTFVACMLLGMIGVFLPAVQVEIKGTVVGKRASLSLYRAETNRDAVRRWLAGYGKSSGKRVGGALVAVLLPHTHGAVNDHLDDVHSAMSDLEGVSDDDVGTATTILQITLWSFLGLHVLAGALVLGGAVRGAHRRAPLFVAAVLSLLIAATGVALYLAWSGAVFEVNDEIGHPALAMAFGAYVAVAAAIGAFASAMVLVVQHLRGARA